MSKAEAERNIRLRVEEYKKIEAKYGAGSSLDKLEFSAVELLLQEIDDLRQKRKDDIRRRAKLRVVVSAAVGWWKSHRPTDWKDPGEHIKNPTVNTTSNAEGELALAVAKLEKEGTK